MDNGYLNITEGYMDNCKITHILQNHSFLLFSMRAIPVKTMRSIQDMDLYKLPCENYIYIKETLIVSKYGGMRLSE